MGRPPQPVEDRLHNGLLIVDECWVWTGYTTGPYGRIKIGGRNFMVHRLAYEMWVGPIPAGLTIDHTCRNTLCVRPDHLEPVTRKINSERQWATTERAMTCGKGHRFTPENTYYQHTRRGTMQRCCRACKRERDAGRRR